MKKNITTSIAFMVMLLAFNSCSKDDPVTPASENLTGKFEIYIDGSLFSQGTTTSVGMIQDNQQNHLNTVTIGNDEISIVVTQFPRSVSEAVAMEFNGDPGISIVAANMYTTKSGTLTRESGSKISFEGKCTKLLETEEHTITGFVEAEVWKKIK